MLEAQSDTATQLGRKCIVTLMLMAESNCARITHDANGSQVRAACQWIEWTTDVAPKARSWRSGSKSCCASAACCERKLNDAVAATASRSLEAFFQTTIKFSAWREGGRDTLDGGAARAVQRHRGSQCVCKKLLYARFKGDAVTVLKFGP